MQNLKHKILFLFFILSLLNLQVSVAQSNTNTLEKADSLFHSKKYTESFAIYENILDNDKMYSPSMLLKMAYIKEGLGSYTQALYYLKLYYKKTNNKSALTKINELAKKHNLEGYEASDIDLFYGYFNKYYNNSLFFLMGIALLLSALSFYIFKQKQRKPFTPALFQMGIILIIFYILNFQSIPEKAIIINSNTYIMEGPSSGSEVLEIVKKGHLVRVIEEQDVWTKVMWKDKIAYIKGKNLKSVN
jgi:hypothetical protein